VKEAMHRLRSAVLMLFFVLPVVIAQDVSPAATTIAKDSGCIAPQMVQKFAKLEMDAMESVVKTRSTSTIANLETLVGKVVAGEEKITNASRLALASIEDNMLEILNDTNAQHAEDQAEVNAARDAIRNCGARAKALQTLKDNGTEALKGKVDKARTKHNDCRTSERSLLDKKVNECNAFKAHALTLKPPDCTCNYDQGPSFDSLACLRSGMKWFTNATASYEKAQGLCDLANATYSKAKKECNDKQTSFEDAFCMYAFALGTTCANQVDCRNTSITARNATHLRVAVSERARKAECESANLVLCLLTVLNASEVEMPALLAGCHNLTVNTTHLNIIYPPIPEATHCDVSDITSLPSDEAWKAKEYKQENWFEAAAAKNELTETVEKIVPKASEQCKFVTQTKAQQRVSNDAQDVDWSLIWKYGGGANGVSVWRPSKKGFCSLGDVIVMQNVATIPTGTAASFIADAVGKEPDDFTWKVAENQAGGINFWEPVCAAGFVTVGHVGVQAPETTKNQKPPNTSVCCVPEGLATAYKNTDGVTKRLWSDGGTGGMDNCEWKRKGLETFVADGTNCKSRFSPPCTTYYAYDDAE